METMKSKEKYRYYVMLNGREFKIDFETYNICKSIIQEILKKYKIYLLKQRMNLLISHEITVNVKILLQFKNIHPKIRNRGKING